MMKKQITYVITGIEFLFCFVLITSCSNHRLKFNKEKWNDQIDAPFPSHYRSQMISDLTSNYKLTGLKYTELTEFLGMPDYTDSSSLAYRIIVKYGNDIDPTYTKDLDFIYSKDSIIISFKVNEWKKHNR